MLITKTSIDRFDEIVKKLISTNPNPKGWQYSRYANDIYDKFMTTIKLNTDNYLLHYIILHNEFCKMIRAYVSTHQLPKSMQQILEELVHKSMHNADVASKYVNALDILSCELHYMQKSIKYVDPNINASTESAAL